jgi:hypothetical protein
MPRNYSPLFLLGLYEIGLGVTHHGPVGAASRRFTVAKKPPSDPPGPTPMSANWLAMYRAAI